MSNRIMICPSCGTVAALVELPAETTTELLDALAAPEETPARWELRSHWCPSCDTPILTAWPARESVGKRRELVGLPADLLKIDEEAQHG